MGSRCVFAKVVLGAQVSHLHLLTEGLAFATEVVPKLYLRSYKKKHDTSRDANLSGKVVAA